MTLCCVSNEVGGDLIGNAWWSGVLIRDLLAEAGVQAGADAVLQTSAGRLELRHAARRPHRRPQRDARVAMNGKPLPVQHGFPVRMVVPGLYGYVSATQVAGRPRGDQVRQVRGLLDPARLVGEGAGEDPVAGSTCPRDGADGQGRVGPRRRQRLGPAHRHREGGVPARRRRWQEAELGRVPNVDTWVQWAATVDVEPGRAPARGPGDRPVRLHADLGEDRRRPRRRDAAGTRSPFEAT